MGATGYVGSRLVPRLVDEVEEVRAMVRDPDGAERFGWGRTVDVVAGDVLDPEAVQAALDGVDTLVYLVHGMGGADFAENDRTAARQVGAAAARPAYGESSTSPAWSRRSRSPSCRSTSPRGSRSSGSCRTTSRRSRCAPPSSWGPGPRRSR